MRYLVSMTKIEVELLTTKNFHQPSTERMLQEAHPQREAQVAEAQRTSSRDSEPSWLQEELEASLA